MEKFYSVSDVSEDGASFIQTGAGGAKPRYNHEQVFPVANARTVRLLTKSASALKCTPRSRC